ncbi:MAG: HAD-IA family hydrolase [Deltaproteobacteria bacterium]|jgi:pyrophosphatase PpaX|nr:HAD-IA family hydrolase [Deltaproteobacteria bacterium]MBW1874739.1 HAD-IA family hydrolase [Deltaproteobacteria bacterium]MBW2212262.1 HAD-IA family hydrolase [Deltaproteobacteria bacterium]MBW2214663.1 HAD-IA family hydrolase [Deltaproteobacteria bacterium]MBW2379084.1 HAD-IA family hydrolase [Deltaproteobacteria bacterium]
MRTYLFDLDGTLLDSIALILTSFHHTSRLHLERELPDSYWLEGTGTPLREQLRKVARSKEELAAMLDTYLGYNLSHHDELAKPYPGVVDVVRTLHARGAKLALVTSKLSRGAERGLHLLGLEEELSVRVCADDVDHGKPHPAPVLMALDALGSSPDDALFIGDSHHDIEAGRRAGVTTVAVTWGPLPRERLASAKPDHWLEEPRQLFEL